MSAPLYRRVDPRLWDDDKFIDLSDDAQLLWLLVLTGPQTTIVPGLMTGGLGTLSEVLRKPSERVSKAFDELLEKGLVEHDPKRRVLRVPNAPKYNEPANPNVLRGWFRAWRSAPESPLKYAHIASLEASIDRSSAHMAKAWEETFGTIPQTLQEGLPEPLPEPFPKQDQEQKQDQDQEIPPYPPASQGGDEGAPPRKSTGQRKRKSRQLSDAALAVQSEIRERLGVDYPPAAFDALEARLRSRDLSESDALAIVRFACGDGFWGGEVKANPATLFRPKHWASLLAQARAAPAKAPVLHLTPRRGIDIEEHERVMRKWEGYQ